RSPEHQEGEGGPRAPSRRPAPDPRHRDESGGPSPRRRRRIDHRGPSPGHPVGRAHAGLSHPQEGQGLRSVRRARPQKGQEAMSRSSKKGPFVEERLMTRIEAMNSSGEKQMLKTWSRTSTIFPEMVGHTIAVHDG